MLFAPELFKGLHFPAREAELRALGDGSVFDCVEATDRFVGEAMALARALYLVLGDDSLFVDARDRDAIHSLASRIADAASAAEVAILIERDVRHREHAGRPS